QIAAVLSCLSKSAALKSTFYGCFAAPIASIASIGEVFVTDSPCFFVCTAPATAAKPTPLPELRYDHLHKTFSPIQGRSSCHVADASVCRRKEGLDPRFP